jgi:hypothetical protein
VDDELFHAASGQGDVTVRLVLTGGVSGRDLRPGFVAWAGGVGAPPVQPASAWATSPYRDRDDAGHGVADNQLEWKIPRSAAGYHPVSVLLGWGWPHWRLAARIVIVELQLQATGADLVLSTANRTSPVYWTDVYRDGEGYPVDPDFGAGLGYVRITAATNPPWEMVVLPPGFVEWTGARDDLGKQLERAVWRRKGSQYTVACKVADIEKSVTVLVIEIDVRVECRATKPSVVLFHGANLNATEPCSALGHALRIWRDNGSRFVTSPIVCKAVVKPDLGDYFGDLNIISKWRQYKGTEPLTIGPAGIETTITKLAADGAQEPLSTGGVYKFTHRLLNTTTEFQVDLPLAGADMTSRLWQDIIGLRDWAPGFIVRSKAYCEVPSVPSLTTRRLDRLFRHISGSVFDYVWDPVGGGGRSPCALVKVPLTDTNGKADYTYVTVNGEVVNAHNLNNALWGMFAAMWGYDERIALAGATWHHVSVQVPVGETPDLIPSGGKYQAIHLGYRLNKYLAEGGDTNVARVMFFTVSDMRAMWDRGEERIWPSPDMADGASTFRTPLSAMNGLLAAPFGKW